MADKTRKYPSRSRYKHYKEALYVFTQANVVANASERASFELPYGQSACNIPGDMISCDSEASALR